MVGINSRQLMPPPLYFSSLQLQFCPPLNKFLNERLPYDSCYSYTGPVLVGRSDPRGRESGREREKALVPTGPPRSLKTPTPSRTVTRTIFHHSTLTRYYWKTPSETICARPPSCRCCCAIPAMEGNPHTQGHKLTFLFMCHLNHNYVFFVYIIPACVCVWMYI